MRAFPKGQGFTVGLLAVLSLAWLWPEGGQAGGPLRAEYSTMAAVGIIFLLQGLNLPISAFFLGLRNWKLHLFVQFFVFLTFPLLVFGMVAAGLLSEVWIPGFLFLSILPTTISTAIVYTSSAGGDAAGATFNATLSNFLGILIVPGWCALLVFPALEQSIQGDSTEGFFADFLLRLIFLIVVPLFLGMLMRPLLGEGSESRGRLFRNLSFLGVLFIAYAGFCQGFLGASSAQVVEACRQVLLPCIVLLAIVSLLAWVVPAVLGFHPSERLAAFFCASQKSLAVGLPMGQLIFGLEHPQIFALLLPLVLYHVLQLLLGGVVVGRFSEIPD